MRAERYRQALERQARYNLSEIVGIEKQWIMSAPEAGHVSTSFAERQTLPMRMGTRRLTSLTKGFNEKIEDHGHAIAFHFMCFISCPKHVTLTTHVDRTHPTIAMAVVVADHVFSRRSSPCLIRDQTVPLSGPATC